MYLVMNSRQVFNSASSFHCLSVGSFSQAAVMTPCTLSKPAGFIAAVTDEETLFRYCTGFQPISTALRMDCAANFGIDILKKTLAPESLSWIVCESTVGSVTSYVTCLTTLLASLPRPSLKPSQ